MTIALWVLAVLLVLIGIAGTVLPGLPGAALIFAGLLLSAWLQQFAYVGATTIAVLGILTLLSFVVDIVAPTVGAKNVGAGRGAVIGAALGTIAAIPFGIPGLVIGPFLGAVIGELAAGSNLLKAGQVGIGTWIGFMVGTLLKIALAFAMVGIFIIAYLL